MLLIDEDIKSSFSHVVEQSRWRITICEELRTLTRIQLLTDTCKCSRILTIHNYSSAIDLSYFAAFFSCVRHWNLTIIYIQVTIGVENESATFKVTIVGLLPSIKCDWSIKVKSTEQTFWVCSFVSFHQTWDLMRMNENQWSSNKVFHVLFISSSFC